MTLIRLITLALILMHVSVDAEQIEIYTESLPPFQIMESHKISGTATDRVVALLDTTNLTYKFNVVPWARAYNIVRTTPNTLLYSMNRTPEREPYFHWIRVVAKIGNAFIAMADKPIHITKLDDAKNYVTAVVREGYAYNTLLKEGFEVDRNMYLVSTMEQQISLLLNGKIDLLFTDIQSVQYSLSQLNLDPALVTITYTEPAWTRDLYLAANKDTNSQILEQLIAKF